MLDIGTLALCLCRRAITVTGHDKWGRPHWTHTGTTESVHHPVPLSSRHELDFAATEAIELRREHQCLRAEVERLRAMEGRVRALAESWRYKGEFGWGAWQEGHGPDAEGRVLDSAASELLKAVAGG